MKKSKIGTIGEIVTEKVTTITVYVDGWPEPKHGEAAFRRELRDLLETHGIWSPYGLIQFEQQTL